MALKDWKVIENKRDLKHWYNDETGVSVFVHLQDYNPEAWGYNKKSEWFVEIEKSNISKQFKSKSQAMSFAKRYMRTH